MSTSFIVLLIESSLLSRYYTSASKHAKPLFVQKHRMEMVESTFTKVCKVLLMQTTIRSPHATSYYCPDVDVERRSVIVLHYRSESFIYRCYNNSCNCLLSRKSIPTNALHKFLVFPGCISKTEFFHQPPILRQMSKRCSSPLQTRHLPRLTTTWNLSPDS